MSSGLVHISNENAPVNVNKNGKPKPLQASTNIIHTKTPRRIDNLIHNRSRPPLGKDINDPLKKKQSSISKKQQSDLKQSQNLKLSENGAGHIQKSANKETMTSAQKVDENDVSAMVKNAYDPLNDVYPLDEELFQRVMKLELADDGIPPFDYSEPFDF